MKKLLFGLIASLLFVSSTHAITSNLNQSINIYQNILDAINPSGEIGQNEFVIDILRVTPGTSFGWNIHYNIKTIQIVSDLVADTNVLENFDASKIEEIEARHSHHSSSHHLNHEHVIIRTYDANLSVLANPAIGPPVVTVKSIKLISTNERHLHL